jgi:methionyl aminopeptidase
MSPNAQVVHGIPNNTPLKSGDVISVDCGAYKMDIMEIMRIL